MGSDHEPASEVAENLIEIRVHDIAQLFHTLDPFPFREKDLADEAEDYIVGWARELPAARPIRIVVHVPDTESQAKASSDLAEAFNRYFAGRAIAVQRDLNECFVSAGAPSPSASQYSQPAFSWRIFPQAI
jgi:hypothetical protein